MKYYEEIKVIADSNKSLMDRGDLIIKHMCRLTEDILNYRYACEKYKGNSDSIIYDKMGTIKNSLSVLISELEIYMEKANITDDVKNKAAKRIHKVAEKLTRI